MLIIELLFSGRFIDKAKVVRAYIKRQCLEPLRRTFTGLVTNNRAKGDAKLPAEIYKSMCFLNTKSGAHANSEHLWLAFVLMTGCACVAGAGRC